MGAARQPLDRVLIGQGGISPDMALRLARLSGTRAETWLALPKRHDLGRTEQDLGPVLAAIPAHHLPRACDSDGKIDHDR